jgi:AAA-like domain
VLTARQMGKSSLRVQVMGQLQDVGVQCSSIDLTGIGSQNITADQWYRGIMRRILQDLQLLEVFNLERFCQERPALGWVQRLSEFVDELLRDHVQTSLVVFVDEIDSTISLLFDSDDFFAWIRYCCNLWADLPRYGRLAFCLLGVATPTDLIQDAIASTQLPGEFHKDPANRILIAISRRYDIPLVTCDEKILRYPHVQTIS